MRLCPWTHDRRKWQIGVKRTEGRCREGDQRAVGERIHRHNHHGRHNQKGVLVRILVHVAVEQNVDLGNDEGEIRIANLVRHVCVRFGF